MIKNILLRFVFAGIFALTTAAFGQGVTTASLNGFVNDKGGKPIAGAAVTAVHTPTNTTYKAVTNSAGRFSFMSVPVGGPYTVSATADGYSMDPLTDVGTSLGESTDIVLAMGSSSATTSPTESKEGLVTMEKFKVTAGVSDLDANTAGTGTVLSNRRISTQPNPGNSFADLIKTNPFATIRTFPQVEALGMNSRYNTITLDGAKINDSFGLNASGLFSLNNPFSLDAVEQLSVSLTPYDVRQSGFAGASINAVSKSGTNTFHGSAYFRFTDKNWKGPDIYGATKGTRSPLKERGYGYTLGGPIIKNHLFFFVNLEKFISDKAPTIAAFTPDPAFLTALNATFTANNYTNLGTFGGSSTSRTTDDKRLFKIDWNITSDHRLSVRYSDTNGLLPVFSSFNATSFSQPATFSAATQPTSFSNGITSLSSNFYTVTVGEKVWAGQLFDNWTTNFKTQVSFSKVEQSSLRDTPIFPEIRIFSVPGTSSAGNPITGGDALRFGTEISSMGNGVIVKTKNIGGSADYNWRDFTFTAGVDNEKSDFTNIFRQGSYGVFNYANLSAFQNDTPSGFQRAVVTTGFPALDTSNFEQTAYFGQVKWQPTSRFNVMLGLRWDSPKSTIAPPANAGFAAAFGVTNAGTIGRQKDPAPRLSFNYALDKERNVQVRGGIGVFQGRNPWVWISNSYGNFGSQRFTTVIEGATTPTLKQYLTGTYSNNDPAYKFDPANPIGVTNQLPSATATQVINFIKPGLKMPLIQRGNLAVDYKVKPLNAVLTFEYVETTQLSALFVDNMNLRPTTVAIDGRQLFAGSAANAPRIAGFGNVIRTRNVHAGASQYAALSLDRPMKNGLAYTLSYTRGHATEAQTLNSSTANSNWQFNPTFNQGQIEVSRSDYEIRNRVQASVSKEFRFKKDFLTTVSLYYEGRSGQIYSFTYANDLNNDGVSTDLVTVPTGPTDPHFDFSGMTQVQQDAYFAFINSSGLSKYAGSYAPRNAFTTAWQNRLDLRVTQEIPVRWRAKLELFADFINFGSWLDHHLFNYIQTINTTPTNGGLQRLYGAATYSNGLIRPTFNNGATPVLALDSNNSVIFAGSTSIIQPSNSENRWAVQGGVRLKF